MRTAVGGAVGALALLGGLAAPVLSTPPPEVIIDQQAADPSDLTRFEFDYGSADYNGRAQSVTMGADGALVAVDLVLAREEWTTADLVFELRQDSPSGPVLGTSDPVPASDIVDSDTAGEWEHVVFSSPPALQAGDVIVITVQVPSPLPGSTPGEDPISPPVSGPVRIPAPAWYWAWSDAGAPFEDAYPGGTAWAGWQSFPDGSMHWSSSSGSDLTFRTYVERTNRAGGNSPAAPPNSSVYSVFCNRLGRVDASTVFGASAPSQHGAIATFHVMSSNQVITVFADPPAARQDDSWCWFAWKSGAPPRSGLETFDGWSSISPSKSTLDSPLSPPVPWPPISPPVSGPVSGPVSPPLSGPTTGGSLSDPESGPVSGSTTTAPFLGIDTGAIQGAAQGSIFLFALASGVLGAASLMRTRERRLGGWRRGDTSKTLD